MLPLTDAMIWDQHGSTHNTPPGLTRQIAIKSPQSTDLHRWYLTHCGSQSLDTDLQHPFYSAWPRWIKKAYIHWSINGWCRGNKWLSHIWHYAKVARFMMTSSNGKIFRFTGPLCGEFTSHRWIPLTKASDAELWCFLWSVPEQTGE